MQMDLMRMDTYMILDSKGRITNLRNYLII